MPPDPTVSPALDFALQVEALYTQLILSAPFSENQEPSLGGKLLYAAELDAHGRALLAAANIAGAASLAATADPLAQKLAIRDGVADFLVTNLDEALRILKNEIRKQDTVAVCVAQSPDAVEGAMFERGVSPDLQRPQPGSHTTHPKFPHLEFAHPARLTWQVDQSPAQWLPRLDALAIACLEPGEGSSRRWLRLAPRYLGRLAQGVRVLTCRQMFAEDFIRQVEQRVTAGQFTVAVQLQLSNGSELTDFRFEPIRS